MALPEPDLDALLKEAPFVLIRPTRDKPRGPVLLGKIVEHQASGPKYFHQYFPSTLTRATSTEGAVVPEEKFDSGTSLNKMIPSRIFLAHKDLKTLALLMKEKTAQLETLRDLSLQRPPVRVLYRNVDYDLLSIDVFTGAATVSKRYAVLPLGGVEDETVALDDFDRLKSWEKEPVVEGNAAPAPQPIVQHQVTVHQKPDTVMAEDGTRRVRIVLAKGREIKEKSITLQRSARWAGTANQPRDMSLQNVLVALDPAWWYHLCHITEPAPNSEHTKPEEFGQQLYNRLCQIFATELSQEMDSVAKKAEPKAGGKAGGKATTFRRLQTMINDVRTFGELFAVAVLSGHSDDKLEELIDALRNLLYRLLASKGDHGWVLQKPTEADLFCPPWYYWRHHPAGPNSRRDDLGNVIE